MGNAQHMASGLQFTLYIYYTFRDLKKQAASICFLICRDVAKFSSPWLQMQGSDNGNWQLHESVNVKCKLDAI